MKFVHTADIHFGALRSLSKGSDEHLIIQREMCDEILRVGIEHGAEVLLIAGDLFQDSKTTIPEFLLAVDFLERAKDVFEKIIVMPGNHDELTVGTFQTQYLKEAVEDEEKKFAFFDQPGTIEYLTRHAEIPVRITAIPWTGIKDQEEFEAHVIQNLPDNPDIVMLHECFNGALMNNGRPYPHGVRVPDLAAVRYFACGDIHSYQRICHDRAWFSGSPLQYTFGDEPGKGVIVGELIPDEPVKLEFVPLKVDFQLKQIRAVGEIQDNPRIWYSLKCSVDEVPLIQPPNLKKIESLPVGIKESTVAEIQKIDDVRVSFDIDYSDGVADILGSMGYTGEEIAIEEMEIRKFVQA